MRWSAAWPVALQRAPREIWASSVEAVLKDSGACLPQKPSACGRWAASWFSYKPVPPDDGTRLLRRRRGEEARKRKVRAGVRVVVHLGRQQEKRAGLRKLVSRESSHKAAGRTSGLSCVGWVDAGAPG